MSPVWSERGPTEGLILPVFEDELQDLIMHTAGDLMFIPPSEDHMTERDPTERYQSHGRRASSTLDRHNGLLVDPRRLLV